MFKSSFNQLQVLGWFDKKIERKDYSPIILQNIIEPERSIIITPVFNNKYQLVDIVETTITYKSNKSFKRFIKNQLKMVLFDIIDNISEFRNVICDNSSYGGLWKRVK